MATAPHPVTGLTRTEVDERVRSGRVNLVPDAPSRTLGQIVRANTLTPVNGIIGVMFVVIMIAAPGPDALFAGVVISNSVIGIVQELRAKRELDRLAVLSAPRARVLRDGELAEIGVSGVVADEILAIGPGDQVVVDGEVVDATALELNESLLTGESDPVLKAPGDEVMSGSFVAAGSGWYRATRIGAESYATTLAEEARRFQLAPSELRQGINLVLRWLTFIIPPVSILLLISLLSAEDEWREALRGTVAAAVAMVPDGLVLLTSIAFIVGILSLARRNALAKELASVELLARVDTLCLDKTGTITTGEIAFSDLLAIGDHGLDQARAALAAVAGADPAPNATLSALVAGLPPPPDWTVVDQAPFSSARKWAAVSFAEQGTWVLGAPEVVLDPADPGADGVRAHLAREADAGRRLVLLARAEGELDGDDLPSGCRAAALALLEDQVRPDAPDILGFFAAQGLSLKVISGDHPATVAAVADRAGIEGARPGIDARDLPDEIDALADALESGTVFGRVTPHQKRAMVQALQSRGHVVAMTGDGVNDVLALKDADMGIAMGAGSPATRAVAQLVLLDNAFATLPVVLAEGRRVINNIERVANLFVAKAAYAVLLAALVGLLNVPFPFLPRHLTLVGTFSIGVPGFFLALEPNVRRAVPGFIARVVRFAIPAGVLAGIVTFVAYEVARRDAAIALEEARTIAVCVLLGIGLAILGRLCRPLNPFRITLLASMAAGYAVTLAVPFLRAWFALEVPSTSGWILVALGAGLGALAIELGPRLVPGWDEPARTEHPARADTAHPAPSGGD